MSIYEHTKIPGYTDGVLNCLLYSLINSLNDIGISAIYYDLHDRYEKERNLFKEDSKLTFMNKVYKSTKKIKTKISKKARMLDKMERIELVEKIIKEANFSINSFSWSLNVENDTGYDNKELLANALESYDNFLNAINSKVISVNSSYRFHNEVDFDMAQLNYMLMIKMENGYLTFRKCEPEIGDLSDEAKTNISYDYLDISIGHTLVEGESEDDVSLRYTDDVICFANDFYEDLRAIVLRLFSICLYLDSQGVDINSLSKEDYHTLFSAFHYYSLSDELENIDVNNEYVTTFDNLSVFYKMYIQSLAMLLVDTVSREEEYIELNEEYKKQRSVPTKKEEIKNTNQDKVDFDDFTHKLLLILKKSNYNE